MEGSKGWLFRRVGMLALLGSLPAVARAHNEAVRPVLECVVSHPDGSYTAVFGYENNNRIPVPIAVGAGNKFRPSPQDRGQPQFFQPGYTPKREGSFAVPFDGSHLVWTLRSPNGRVRTSTASARSKRCSFTPGTPDARDDTAATRTGVATTITVLANDSDPQGQTLAVARLTAPANGTTAANADGTVTYTPTAGFVGTDSFTYTVTDGRFGWDQATVRVTVKPEVADTTPPTITASIDPPPNAAAWHRIDVTVSFTCADGESGVASCPAPVVVGTEGRGQLVMGTATDRAGNSASTRVTVNLDRTPPDIRAEADPAANPAGWNNTEVTVTFVAEDPLSGLASLSPPVTVSTEAANQVVLGQATDAAGNVAFADVVLSLDKTPPQVKLTAPTAGTTVRLPRVTATGEASDRNLATVTVNGIETSGTAFSVELPLAEGPQPIVARALDLAGNEGTASTSVVYQSPPVVKITSPANLSAFGRTPIRVTGTVDDPQATVVVGLERVPASVSGDSFVAEGVNLDEGGNVLTAVATDPLANSGSDSVTVVLDTVAPRVIVDSPPDGSATTDAAVDVVGRVHDIVLGTINSGQARVTVNGVPAEVANRTFRVPGIALAPGTNTITATVVDAVGNSDTKTITVLREVPTAARLTALSGSGQSAGIGEPLPQPLVVEVTDAAGLPLAGREVVFRVLENNGELLTDAGSGRGLVVPTDDAGRAQARYRIGTRAGVGNNRVEATSPGIAGAAVFLATAVTHPPGKINVDSGGNQKGVVGQPLPRPFVAVVTDEGHNRLPGVAVTFKVDAGGGSFNGEPELAVTTDPDGRAVAVLTLGPAAGVESNVVSASVSGVDGLPAAFTASGLEPGDPAQTRISGVVLDNANVPIPGVTLRIRGTALASTSDEQGQFALNGVPVGDVHLFVDGSTAQRPGVWPNLEFDLVTVPGADNTLGMPVYLLPLDTQNGLFVDETHGGTLTLPDYPGFSLTVGPNSATFPDGTRRGTITVTVVHADKVPMVPNFGQQPRFIVTVQPPGVRFDPPAQVTHPNVDGLAPGEVTEIYSFDHDMGSFVATGTATVSEDGSVIRSDPGTGIVKGGWHCGGNPNKAGTVADCDDCQICDGVKCVANPDAFCSPCKKAQGKACDTSGQCKTGVEMLPLLCSRGRITDVVYNNPRDIPPAQLGASCGVAVQYCIVEVVQSCKGTDLRGATLFEEVTSDGGCNGRPGPIEHQSAGWPIDEDDKVLPSTGAYPLPLHELHGPDVFALVGPPNAFPQGSCTEIYTQRLKVNSCLVVTARIAFTVTRSGNVCSGSVGR